MPAADQRIRQVAIVLQSLDAGTARSLLGQLPPDMARLVKQAMTKLGTVSASERAQAMNDLQSMLHALQPSTGTMESATESPAAALLAESSSHDRVEWSANASPAGAASNTGSPLASRVTESELPWLAWDPSALATFLANERPTVIATVLNQLSPERAKALLDHLPVETAGATLAAIPNLFLVDPSILTDILAEVEKKLPKQQPTTTTATIAGIAKLAAIIEQFQGNQKQAWLKAIAAKNPDVAMQLGWHGPSNPSSESSFAGLPPSPLPSNAAISGNDEASDIFESPRILSMESHRKDANRPKLDSESEQETAPNSLPLQTAFDDLLHLTDGDLVTLLHSCERTDVLHALRNASPAMLQRIERLIPRDDLKKFRDFLRRMPHQSESESSCSQKTILEQSERLMASGRIAQVDRVSSFKAA
ncbi:Flagellar motor switch protein FliG [Pirellula sp. SH-Sr6A]|uniref:FliG C-terminal domain-containing protein n=1 Tax=Pirellula sp. SH-Sr6A TaxID=1632865 RepID=UPI00078BFC23|nr:FliG C-terminal domain-containing protein [Pirellula sp. SH-Sr6A]AMV33265.1 Flagellar motor switch protein FliG [Pirellula sp. SH-Sr6A]